MRESDFDPDEQGATPWGTFAKTRRQLGRWLSGKDKPTMFAVKLTYSDRYVMMWLVTWEHIVTNFIEQWREDEAKKARKARARGK